VEGKQQDKGGHTNDKQTGSEAGREEDCPGSVVGKGFDNLSWRVSQASPATLSTLRRIFSEEGF